MAEQQTRRAERAPNTMMDFRLAELTRHIQLIARDEYDLSDEEIEELRAILNEEGEQS